MSDLKLPLSCEQFEAHVSDYIDGAMLASDRAAMDAHAAQCDRCLALLAEVRDIVSRAATLPPLSPSRDLWSGIAEQLDTPVVSIGAPNVLPARTRTVSFRMFAAAAALLVAVSSGITYVITRVNTGSSATPAVVAVATPNTTPGATAPSGDTPTASTGTPNRAATTTEATEIRPASVPFTSRSSATPTAQYTSRVENSAEFAYEREITAMRRIVDERLGDLDSVTVVEIERNLRIIDKAVNDSRRALQNDPRSRFLSRQLDRALENKLDIMRRIALL